MTVKDLIEELQKMPSDATVLITTAPRAHDHFYLGSGTVDGVIWEGGYVRLEQR